MICEGWNYDEDDHTNDIRCTEPATTTVAVRGSDEKHYCHEHAKVWLQIQASDDQIDAHIRTYGYPPEPHLSQDQWRAKWVGQLTRATRHYDWCVRCDVPEHDVNGAPGLKRLRKNMDELRGYIDSWDARH